MNDAIMLQLANVTSQFVDGLWTPAEYRQRLRVLLLHLSDSDTQQLAHLLAIHLRIDGTWEMEPDQH